MTQVTRITEDIIVNALYLTGELGVGETPDAFMLVTGLEIINELLDSFSVDSIYIPFLKTVSFTFVPGQGTYSISDIVPADIISSRVIDLSFANFIVQPATAQPITYPLRIINKATFYNVVRLQNLTTRPGFVFLDKQAIESFVTFYPAPDQPYLCKLQFKVMIDQLQPQQSINELPPYYYGFMKYAVAREFIAYYPSANWPQQNEDKYQEYYSNLKNTNETDLTIRTSAIITMPQPFVWWQNILAF